MLLLHIEQAEEHIYKFSGIDEGNIPRLKKFEVGGAESGKKRKVILM